MKKPESYHIFSVLRMPSKQNRIQLSELEPETDYSLTIQGQNVAGSSPISNSIRFRTKPIGKYNSHDIA